MKFTEYFLEARLRPDRAYIRLAWITHVVRHPVAEETQPDGHIRLWAPISEHGGRVLRVILLQDRGTVHNAFFDRGRRR